MNFQYAAEILGLSGKTTPEETRKAWLAAVKKYHPDVNPAGEQMAQMINAAYDTLKDHDGNIEQTQVETNGLYSEEVSEALNKIINCIGLEIEVCGCWIWVDGDTKKHKETLKEVGFRWANKKKKWSFSPTGYKTKSRGSSSMSDIRENYGSQRVKSKFNSALTARGI